MSFQDLVDETEYAARQYSGRGMYGTYCLGIICDNTERAVLDIYRAGIDAGLDPDYLYDILVHACTDSMGTSSILYFPRYTWVDSD